MNPPGWTVIWWTIRAEQRLLGHVVRLEAAAGQQVKGLEEALVLGDEEVLERRRLADLGRDAQARRLDYHAP